MKYVESARFLSQLPRKLSRLAALDVGTKHIGVALSDEGRIVAQPHSTMERGPGRNGPEAVSALTRKIQALIDAEQIDGLVVGAPTHQGQPTELCEEIVQLMLAIQCRTAQASPPDSEMLFTLWNENSSTVEARRASKALGAKRSTFVRHKDEMAAAVILNSFLQKYST